jgi:hypothetical protein
MAKPVRLLRIEENMLTRFISDLFKSFLEVILWLLLVIGVLAGYFTGSSIGAQRDQSAVLWGIWGGIGGLLGTFLLEVVVFGAILTLLEIERSVKEIESRTK